MSNAITYTVRPAVKWSQSRRRDLENAIEWSLEPKHRRRGKWRDVREAAIDQKSMQPHLTASQLQSRLAAEFPGVDVVLIMAIVKALIQLWKLFVK